MPHLTTTAGRCTELLTEACERFDMPDRLRLAAGLIDLALLRGEDPIALLSRAQFIVHGIDAQLQAVLRRHEHD
jgi:hypothetical protein